MKRKTFPDAKKARKEKKERLKERQNEKNANLIHFITIRPNQFH